MSGLDYTKCVSCGGGLIVKDLGSGERRPCICQTGAYAIWVKERQPATRRVAKLDELGRCCGRKPIVYKRPSHHFFCVRCCADINPHTKTQLENWAWVADGDEFVATSPTAEYARRSA